MRAKYLSISMIKEQIAEATKEFEEAKDYLKSKQDALFLLNLELNKLKEKKDQSKSAGNT